MLARLFVVAFALLLVPCVAQGQRADPPLAKGDSVSFSFPTDPGPTTWTGVVREMKNRRDCVFVLVRSYEGSEMFGIAFKFFPGFEITRLAPAPTVFSADDLRAIGIECIEAHPKELPMYLNPEPSAEVNEGA